MQVGAALQAAVHACCTGLQDSLAQQPALPPEQGPQVPVHPYRDCNSTVFKN